MARVTVEIVEGPLLALGAGGGGGVGGAGAGGEVGRGAGGEAGGEVGAVLVFEGVVRGTEAVGVGGGEVGPPRRIGGLVYEAYRPMAERELERLALAAVERFGVVGVAVAHSVGLVKVGEVSLRVVVRSVHRGEGLAAMGWYIEALKQDVPIWKRVVG